MAIVGERVPLETNELAGMAALLRRWQREQVKAVVARVVDIEQPARSAGGEVLAVNERGEVGGSLGRCDRYAVICAALEVLQQGRPRLVSIAGGPTIHVFLEPLDCRLLVEQPA